MTPRAERTDLDAHDARTLVWDGDALLDPAGGCARLFLDGTYARPCMFLGFRFDTAQALGGLTLLTSREGTKGLLLEDGHVLREIDRSHYFAAQTHFPAALVPGADGAPWLVHCPESYCELALEDARTGEDRSPSRGKAPDFFHGRLLPSPSGRYLASCGWVWHPFDAVAVYDLQTSLTESLRSDGLGEHVALETAGTTVAWLDDHRLYVASVEQHFRDESARPDGCVVDASGDIWLHRLSLVDLANDTAVTATLPFPAGAMLAIDERHVLTLEGHPRLVDVTTGAVVEAWPDVLLRTELHAMPRENPSVIALDAAGRRAAMKHGGRITVLSFARP